MDWVGKVLLPDIFICISTLSTIYHRLHFNYGARAINRSVSVIGEEGIEKGAKHTALGYTSVQDGGWEGGVA